MEFDQVYILLSVQRGLLDNISFFLRAVTLEYEEVKDLFILRFFYDHEVTEKLFDLSSCVTVEINPDTTSIVSRCDYPERIPIQGRLVYLRNEPISTVYKQESAIHFADASTPLIAVLLLAMQDALLGKVTPELRIVTISANSSMNELGFYFFYDGEISQKNMDLANSAIREASNLFPGYSVVKRILRVDYPEKIPDLGERVPYARYENDS